MQVALRYAAQKDAARWNDTVRSESSSTFFDTFEWCQGLGKISERIIPLPLLIEENGKITGVFPTCLIRNSFHLQRFESLPFSDYGGGPFFRKKEITKRFEFMGNFVKGIYDLGLKNKCLDISIRRAYFPNLISPAIIRKPIITDVSTCSFIISLEGDIHEIYGKMDGPRRRSIRQGEKRGAVVFEAQDSEDLQSFYSIYVRTLQRLGSNPLPYSFFDYIWGCFIRKKTAKLFLASYNDKPIGGILLFIHKGVCNYWTGGTLNQFNDKRPMDLLIWHSIKWALTENLGSFDLGATYNDPSSGLYLFKKAWGGQKRVLYNYRVLLQPTKWRLLKFTSDLMNRFKNAPARASERLCA